jgi:hypothetical protein
MAQMIEVYNGSQTEQAKKANHADGSTQDVHTCMDFVFLTHAYITIKILKSYNSSL